MKSHIHQIFMTGLLSNLHPMVAHRIENDYWFHRSKWMENILKEIFDFFEKSLGRNCKTLVLTATVMGGREALTSNLAIPGNRNSVIFIDDVSKNGELNNLIMMVKETRKKFPETIVIIDLSNSFGADKIDLRLLNADGYIFIPERALGGIPGVTFISLRQKVFDRIRKNRKHLKESPFTLDLLKHEAVRDHYSTPFSPDISALVGLGASLDTITKGGGLKSHIARHAYWAKTIRVYLARYGFNPMTQKSKLSNAFTIFNSPQKCNTKKLVKDLEKKGIIIQTINDNQHQIRIGHAGYLPSKNLRLFLNIWKEVAHKHLSISFPVPRISQDISEVKQDEHFKSTTKILLAPGPTKYHPDVFRVTKNYYHPGTKKGDSAISDLKKTLKIWLNNVNEPLFLSTPSTGLMEASIANLTSLNDRGLIISHGKFGERFKNIARARNRRIEVLEMSDRQWGQVFSPKEIDTYLKNDLKKIRGAKTEKISFVCFQQTETSSGVSYHMPHLVKIIQSIRRYNPHMMIIMDGVSGIAVHDINLKKLSIDAVILGSQKGLGVSSGISYVQLSNLALAYMLHLSEYKKPWGKFIHDSLSKQYIEIFEKKQNVHYFSFLRLMLENSKVNYNTAQSVFHILSTIASIRLMKKQGGKKHMTRKNSRMAQYVRSEAIKMGLKILAYAPYQSNSVTSLLLPKNISAPNLRKKLENEYGIFIAGAQSDYWKSNMIRIGHMGYISEKDVKQCMRAIRTILSL